MNATDARSSSADIVAATAEYVAALFRDPSTQSFPFHNYQHTTEVVQAAQQIGVGEGLTEQDLEIVTVAAWMHDVGYFEAYRGHEEKSAETARSFLRERGYPAEQIELVARCILATRYPQQPETLLERVICDADMAHLGGDGAAERSAALRLEQAQIFGKHYDDQTWSFANLAFLQNQHYHTETARRLYEANLQEHIRRQWRQLKSDMDNSLPEEASDGNASGAPSREAVDTVDTATVSRQTAESEKKAKGEKTIKKLRKELKKIQKELQAGAGAEIDGFAEGGEPGDEKGAEVKGGKSNSAARLDRGIETMFRTTSRNHIDLSGMADSKANIMISVNSIIISIVASVLLGKLDTDPEYMIPTVILLSVCLMTIIFSILATRPKISSGTFTQEDIKANKVNLLFFGNFHSVSLEDYQEGVMAMMNDSDYLYGSMIKDIYFLGKVLGRKYKFLRISYNVFMYGLVLSVIAFIVAAIVGSPSPVPAIQQVIDMVP